MVVDWNPVAFNENYYLKRSRTIFSFVFSLELYIMKHCVKSVRIRSYSNPHFPAFGLHTERYGVHMDQNNSEYGHFLHRESCKADDELR